MFREECKIADHCGDMIKRWICRTLYKNKGGRCWWIKSGWNRKKGNWLDTHAHIHSSTRTYKQPEICFRVSVGSCCAIGLPHQGIFLFIFISTCAKYVVLNLLQQWIMFSWLTHVKSLHLELVWFCIKLRCLAVGDFCVMRHFFQQDNVLICVIITSVYDKKKM